MKLSSPLAPVVASFTATIVFIFLNGYAFGGSTQRLPGTSPSSDHVNVLPQVFHQHDPALFPRDPQIQMGATFATIVWPIIGRLCPLEGIPWTFFVLHIISLTAVFLLLWRLAVECCERAGAPSIAAAMGGVSMMEGAQTPIIATPPLAAQGMGHPVGNDKAALAGLLTIILFIVIRISPAAEPTYDTAFYTRGAALPLGLAAILFAMRGRIVWAAAMLILMAVIHAITALHVLCVCLPLELMSGAISRRRWIIGTALATLGFAAMAWGVGQSTIPVIRDSVDAWIAMQRAVNGSHLFVDLIPQSAWREFAVCALFLLPALGSARGKQMLPLAAAALIGAAASLVLGMAGQILESQVLLPLSPLRGFKLTMMLALVSAAVVTWQSLHGMIGASSSRSLRISGIAGGAALLALVCRQQYAAVAAFVLMMIFGDSARWMRTVALVAASAIGIWFIGVDAAHGWDQSTRTSWLIAGGAATGVVMLAVWTSRVGRVIDPPIRADAGMGGPGGLGLVIASLAALALLSIPAQRDGVWVYAAHDYPWTQPPDPWAEAQRWVAKNTPIDSLFLVPPWLEGFRTFAQRSEFVEYKMGTLSLFHPKFGQEWASRMSQLTPRQLSSEAYDDMARNYSELTPADFAVIVERYGITHMVVLARRADLPYRTVYQNALLWILDTTQPR